MHRFMQWISSEHDQSGESEAWRHSLIQRRIGSVDYLRPQRWNWYALMRPLDRSLERSSSRPMMRDTIRALRYLWLDGLFSSMSDNFYVGFISLFALAYGASNSQVGWSVAMANLLGAVALFPGARMVERTGKRRGVVVWTSGGIGRLALLALACLPLLVLHPGIAIPAIIAINGLRGFMANFANPAWTALVADIVPEPMRGRYFGKRQIGMSVAAMVVAPIAGWLIMVGNGWPGMPYLGFQFIFFLAFLSGIANTLAFYHIPDTLVPPHPAPRSHQHGWREVIQVSPAFWGFVFSAFIWNLAIQVSAPFFNVFMARDLHWSMTEIGLLSSVSSLASLAGYHLFGHWIDRKGNLWAQRLTGLTIPLLPTAWIFVTSPWHVAIINLMGGLLWAGYNLSNFNLLLDLTPDEQRPRAVALYQTAVFGSAVIGPLLGGYVADATGFQLVFGLSAAGRTVGTLAFLLLVDRAVRRATDRLQARPA